jgi:hypothetical protein
MASAAYINEGTALKFNGEAGADVAFSIEGVADGAGRISAQKDWGAAPRAYIYHVSAEVLSQATPTQYGSYDFYIAEAPSADSTQVSGDEGTSDAALGDVDSARNMKYVGSVIVENAAAEKFVGSFEFVSYARYWSLVMVNNSGATTNATDSNNVVQVTPVYVEGQ